MNKDATKHWFVLVCGLLIFTSPPARAWYCPCRHDPVRVAKHQKQEYLLVSPRNQYLSPGLSQMIISRPASWSSTPPTVLYASWTNIQTIPGSFDAQSFAVSNCWGQQPLLLQESFQTESLFSWDDICELAMNQDEESIISRLITHEPGTLDTFRLHFGPFSETELHDFTNVTPDEDDERASKEVVSTLVLNDVDRWIPSLSDWMDQQFGFLPRWRRDDAQVSLARVGGGIGPHVDNYDVFLIQASGTRTWKIGLETLSVKDEFENLVEASEVRVLDLEALNAGEFATIELGPGDCLYLPPRVVHWGSSTSNDCMTLSVGCRAPSASELLQRVTESITDSFIPSALATARYTDDVEEIRIWSSAEQTSKDLSTKVKDKMKQLVLDLVKEQLEDDALWDRLVGELVTEPNRPSMDYPTPLSDMDDEWKTDLGIWADAEQALEAVLNGKGVLRRAEGISFAWSGPRDKENMKWFTLFAQGRSFRLKNDNSNSAPRLLEMIVNDSPLSQKQLSEKQIELSETTKEFLRDLLQEGLLYGDDDDEEEGEQKK